MDRDPLPPAPPLPADERPSQEAKSTQAEASATTRTPVAAEGRRLLLLNLDEYLGEALRHVLQKSPQGWTVDIKTKNPFTFADAVRTLDAGYSSILLPLSGEGGRSLLLARTAHMLGTSTKVVLLTASDARRETLLRLFDEVFHLPPLLSRLAANLDALHQATLPRHADELYLDDACNAIIDEAGCFRAGSGNHTYRHPQALERFKEGWVNAMLAVSDEKPPQADTRAVPVEAKRGSAMVESIESGAATTSVWANDRQRKILDLVASQQLSTAAPVPARFVRSSLRQFGEAGVNAALESCSPRFLERHGESPRESLSLTLRGLAESEQGPRVSRFVEGIIAMFQRMERSTPAFETYTWSDVRDGLGLDDDSFDWTVAVITIANLWGGGNRTAGPPPSFTFRVPTDIERILRIAEWTEFLAERAPPRASASTTARGGPKAVAPSELKEASAAPLEEFLKYRNNADEFQALVELVRAGRILPFVGAGLSIPSGYPSWTRFLLDEAAAIGLSTEVKADIDAGAYEEAAQRLSDRLGHFAFDRRIQHVYAKPRSPQGAIRVLPRITPTSLFTTNFDAALEQVFFEAGRRLTTTWGTRYVAVGQALFTTRPHLLKVHGDANDASDRVLTRSDYETHYGPGSGPWTAPLPTALARLFSSAPLLFLGCSLTVDRTMRILAQAAEQPAAPTHFALVEAPAREDELMRRVQALGALRIAPIWYPPGAYDWIEPMLRALAEEAGR
jgi:SIR2-like domain